MEHRFDDVDILAVDTIRTLSMDAVERADSGHPGTPMALAPVAYVLFSRFLSHSPEHPAWVDRDRFVLSCGHASMLLYSALHLTGYGLGLDELKDFRQWGSRTPGHPEHGHTPGVEITTGPLGQGCGASVGMALAEAHQAARFNRPGHEIVDHRTWVLCSDGDLMEGVAQEAASLAGHLGLAKLTWIWDDNRITIEGATDLAFSEDVRRRFEALGWHVLRVEDANDLEEVAAALAAAVTETGRPTLVAVRSHIAWGAPNKQDTADAHGAPLGEAEIRGAKARYGWPPDEQFRVPSEALERCRQAIARGVERVTDWQQRFAAWQVAHPELADAWASHLSCRPVEGWRGLLPQFDPAGKGVATRAASGMVLNALAGALPELIGGSADLSPSNKTTIKKSGSVARGHWGERNLHFGIREHGMAALLNGLALHGGVRPFGATFLVFADYMRPSIRLAALMGLPVIYVFTHDSIWVGEDGPTHQPVEHLLSLRAIPELVVIRPSDATETSGAWAAALERTAGPTAIVLSRQSLPVLEGSTVDGVARGAYVVAGGEIDDPGLVLIATGSEVALAVAAGRELALSGIRTRVVSMPSWELFDLQDEGYRRSVLPPGRPKLAVEAGVSRGWREYVGDTGAVVALDRFGASAPGEVVAEKLGLTVAAVVDRARRLLSDQ